MSTSPRLLRFARQALVLGALVGAAGLTCADGEPGEFSDPVRRILIERLDSLRDSRKLLIERSKHRVLTFRPLSSMSLPGCVDQLVRLWT